MLSSSEMTSIVLSDPNQDSAPLGHTVRALIFVLFQKINDVIEAAVIQLSETIIIPQRVTNEVGMKAWVVRKKNRQ